MPMLGYLFEPGICLLDEFREGNESPGAGHVAFYLDCVQRMPKGKRITQFRADSASYQAALINALGIIAYNLFIGFRRLTCPETWGRHTIATFRWKLVQIAGRIVHHAGQVVLKLAVEADLLSKVQGIRRRCYEVSLSPA